MDQKPLLSEDDRQARYDYNYSVEEPGNLLDVSCSEIRAILQPKYRTGHAFLLRTFGITTRKFVGYSMYCLLGEGSFVALGEDHGTDLINAEFNPMYWRAQPDRFYTYPTP